MWNKLCKNIKLMKLIKNIVKYTMKMELLMFGECVQRTVPDVVKRQVVNNEQKH